MPPPVFALFLLFIMCHCCHCQQPQDHLIVRATEKLPVHSEVINLRRLLLPSAISDSAIVDFSLAKRDDFPYMYFLINHSSRGILTIRKPLDRDELCRTRRCRCDTWCDLELEIIINGEQFNIELITVRVLDINDHNPEFINGNMLNLTIVESAQIGAMLKLEPAVDRDQGRNGVVGYSIVSRTPLPFSLRYDLTRADLSLVVEQSLDREITPSYSFDIVARDGDNRTGTLHVYVTLDDVNDSAPKFEQTTYTVTNVSENIRSGSILVRVHATDEDDGVNGAITYHLVSSDSGDHCFQVDEKTGDIRVTCSLDYETRTMHRLEIEARDGGEGVKTDVCTVLINVIDDNDNSPVIDVYPADLQIDPDHAEIFLLESLPIHTLVISLSITDRDSGDHGRVTWKLDTTSLIPFELIRLTDNTGELRTTRLLDREQTAEYSFILEAADHGRPISRSTRLHIHIIVMDENDNVPRFQSEHMHATISEHVKIDSKEGYEVFHLHANDPDEGVNGQIQYSIVNNDMNKYFRIDSLTGIIRAIVEFDRKKQETHLLHVEARDQGSPASSARATITFTIVTRNQHTPVCRIDDGKTSWTVMENSVHGTEVGTISCQDDDKDGPNGQISVHARWWPEQEQWNKTKPSIPFEILTRKSNTSETITVVTVSVNGSVDRELVSLYPLLLIISDQGNPSRSTNISLSIVILDENDHCPELHIESSFIMINRDLIQTNQFITHLIASDNDIGLNGRVTFELSPSTSPPFVRLHSNGTLIVQTNSNLAIDGSLTVLHVQIRDHGQPTPCHIVETLRLFIGSNRTDWATVVKNNINDEASKRLNNEQYQQGKRMAHPFAAVSSSMSSPLSKHSASLSSSSTRKQMFAVFLGSTILISIVILTSILCFVDRLCKKTKKTKIRMVKSNGVTNNSPCGGLVNGKRIASSSPAKNLNRYQDDSPTHQYMSMKSSLIASRYPPTVVVASTGGSHSSSSIDSTTRVNTVLNRTIANTYSYTAIGTNDDLTPVDFDDDDDILDDDMSSSGHQGVELMMTTV